VPRAELACCRVGCDGELMAAQLSRAALRLLSCQSRPSARAANWCACMAWGTGAPRVVAVEFVRRGCAT
jgi:hypothetical protein